jgi:hypothetical protein
MEIVQARTELKINQACELFREYERWLDVRCRERRKERVTEEDQRRLEDYARAMAPLWQ